MKFFLTGSSASGKSALAEALAAALARAQRACAAWADAAGEVSSGAVTWHKRPAGRSDLFWKEVSPG